MKKLMIAAAAAAMIGGVQAAEIATYEFTAMLRTTIGVPGEDQTDYVGPINLGCDFSGNTMWYNDAKLLTLVTDDGTPGTAGYKGRVWKDDGSDTYKALTNDLKWVVHYSLVGGLPYPSLEIIAPGKVLDKNGPAAKLIRGLSEGTDGYGDYSYDDGVYCVSFTWVEVTKAVCWRYVGTASIVEDVSFDREACCARGAGDAFTNPTTKIAYFDAVDEGFLNRFGAQKAENANLLEIYAKVDAYLSEDRRHFFGWLAGQGWQEWWPAVGGTKVWNIPVQITGNILGVTEAPECTDCCVRPLPRAVAFKCLDTAAASDTTNPWDAPTAAYGSFTLSLKSFVKQ